MADGKNIEIKIAATGGDQAAAEVAKVTTGFGGMLEAGDKARQAQEAASAARLAQIDAEKAALAELARAEKTALDEELDGMKQKEKAAADYAASFDNQSQEKAAVGRKKEIAGALGAIGVAAAAAAKTFGQIQTAFDSIDLTKLKGIDAAMAEQIETAKTWSMALEDPIGALLKWTTGETVASAFAGMNEQINLTAKQQADAIDRVIAKGVIQADELKKLTDAIKAANAVLDARDKAAGIKRDNADAEAVRNGAAKEDVEVQRARDNVDVEIERINRGLSPKQEETQKAFETAKQKRINAEDVARTPGAKADDLRRAQEEAGEAQKKYEALKLEYAAALKVAEFQRQGVRDGATGKVAELEANKEERLQKEKAAATKKADDIARKAETDRLQAARKAAAEELRATAAANSARVTGSGKAGSTQNPAGAAALKSLGKDLGSADTQAEIDAAKERIAASQAELGNSIVGAMQKMLAGQEALVKKIQVLEGQIKNQRK